MRRGHYFRAAPRAANGSFYDYDLEESNGFPVGYQQDDFYVDVTHVFFFDDGSKLTVNPSFDYLNLKEQSWISQYGVSRLPPLGSRSGQDSEEIHWNFKSYYERDLAETLSSLIGVDARYIDFQRADALELKNGNDYEVTPQRTDLGQWPLWGLFGQLTWKPVARLAITPGQPLDRLTLNLWGRSATESQVSDPITGNTKLDGWTQLDCAAVYSIKRFDIRAKIVNLLDADYEVGGTVVRPLPRYGRGFELSLGYYF